MKRGAVRGAHRVTLEDVRQWDAEAEYARVAAAAAADLAARRLCLATEGGGVCQLDAGHKPPHRARVGDRIDTPRGPRRQIIEWGAK